MEQTLVAALPGLGTRSLRRCRTVSADVDDLYRREASALLGMMVAFLGDRATAEDVVQEAFARVHRRWSTIDPIKAPAYLRTTAFNVARSGLRRRAVSRAFRPDPVQPVGDASDLVVLAEDQRALITAVRRLPLRQRECIVLRYFSDLPETEVAEILGISRNSVKTHVRRGLSALERALEGQH